MARSYEAMLGRIVAQSGKLSAKQVQAAFQAQRRERPSPPLEVVLAEQRLLTHEDLAGLLADHAEELRSFDSQVDDRQQLWQHAAQAIRSGWAVAEDVNRALREHARREDAREPWTALGQLMAELGLLRSLGGSSAGRTPAPASEDPTTLVQGFSPPTERSPAPGGGDDPTIRTRISAVGATGPSPSNEPTVRTPLPPELAPRRPAGRQQKPKPAPPSPSDSRPLLPVDEHSAADPLFPSGPRLTRTQSKLVGRWIGKYWIESEIGRGGMGVVYRAVHADRKSIPVALKVLLKNDPAAQRAAARFRQEAKANARLKHPAIVQVMEVGEDAGYTFIAMEFVEGTTLDRLLDAPSGAVDLERKAAAPTARAGLRPKVAVDLARQIAEAIQYAHDAGVIHRDLKPANVLRDREGQLKVMDFGLAKVVDGGGGNITGSGAVLGTPAYMSPEQADGNSATVDVRSDVYQLGAILYELLTGHRPYEGSNSVETVLRILSGESPPPPTRWDPRIDPEADRLCRTAMAHDREERYPTARAFAEDCERYLAGTRVQGRG